MEQQLDSVGQRLLRYYVAFERGTMTDEDAAPRIRELRAEQFKLQKARDDLLAESEDSRSRDLDMDEVLGYVQDLRELLSEGSFIEQKGFLRSFVKRIDYQPGQVSISYTIPMQVNKEKSDREVLSISVSGEPGGIRTRDTLIKSQVLFL